MGFYSDDSADLCTLRPLFYAKIGSHGIPMGAHRGLGAGPWSGGKGPSPPCVGPWAEILGLFVGPDEA